MVHAVQVHSYMQSVVRTLQHNGCADDVDEVEVEPTGQWRPKGTRVPLLNAVTPDAPPPAFDRKLLKPEQAQDLDLDVVDLTNDDVIDDIIYL